MRSKEIRGQDENEEQGLELLGRGKGRMTTDYE